MNGKNIYLVFTKTGTWLSRLIYAFSRIKYAHASISFDNSFTRMYSFGRTDPDNPFSGGFVEENLFNGVYKKFSGCECLIYRIPVSEEQFNSIKMQVEEFIRRKESYGYNFLGLVGILLNIPIRRKNAYFCSQFVSEILMKSKVFQCEKQPELVKTNDLHDIRNKEMVYKGFARVCTFRDAAGIV